MSTPPPSPDVLRARTRAHYDTYSYRFDQPALLEEKMQRRILGAAIRGLPASGATILDVGCGACRVAHMVRAAGKGRAIGVDLSIRTLQSAALHNPDPVVNGDNMSLPVRSDVADLVVSNGVIMVTPDAKVSFGELARVTKPGGTLVVSVYNKRSWYYPVYRYGGPVVRGLRALIGDRGLKLTIFPCFHVSTMILIALVMRKRLWIPVDISWNLFHDQLTTPHCTFHTFEEVARWAAESGLICDEQKKEAANQLITFKLRKPLPL